MLFYEVINHSISVAKDLTFGEFFIKAFGVQKNGTGVCKGKAQN